MLLSLTKIKRRVVLAPVPTGNSASAGRPRSGLDHRLVSEAADQVIEAIIAPAP
jgi:hypothetical protein